MPPHVQLKAPAPTTQRSRFDHNLNSCIISRLFVHATPRLKSPLLAATSTWQIPRQLIPMVHCLGGVSLLSTDALTLPQRVICLVSCALHGPWTRTWAARVTPRASCVSVPIWHTNFKFFAFRHRPNRARCLPGVSESACLIARHSSKRPLTRP